MDQTQGDPRQQQNGQFGKRLGKGAIGFGAVDAALEFGFRRHNNPEENMLVSVGAAGATAAAWMLLPGVMWAKTGYDVAKGVGGAVDGYRRNAYESQMSAYSNMAVMGGNFQDTEYGATSRQRGMQAIKNSRLNARSALSNEARSLHHF